MKIRSFLLTVVLFSVLMLFHASEAYATTFSLTAPTGTLTRGQNVTFTLNVDTQSESLTSTQVDMSYKTDFLEYVSVSPGDTFSTVTPTDSGGKLHLVGSNSSGFSGAGTYATVTFKLIAEAAGETELCTLSPPETTPTVGPSSSPTITQLPKTGEGTSTINYAVLGIVFIGIAFFFFLLSKRGMISTPHHRKRKMK